MDGYALEQNSQYPKLFPLPENLNYFSFIDKHTDFNKNSNYYNNILSFGAIGVDNGRDNVGFEKINGNHAVKLNGRTYFYLPNSGYKNKGINYFLFDALHELTEYCDNFNNNSKSNTDCFREKVIMNLFKELKEINPYAEDLNLLGNSLKNKKLVDKNNKIVNTNLNELISLKSTINEKTHYLEIGAVVSDMSDSNIIIKYKLKDEFKFVPSNSKYVEPLVYPLLHPFGETGWDSSIKDSVSFLQYMLSRWLMPEATYYSNIDYNNYNIGLFDINNKNNIYFCKNVNINGDSILCSINKSGNAIIPTNRFHIMNRVGQVHLVDGLSRSLDYRLQWFNKNQSLIFGNRDNSNDDYYIEENEMSCNDINDLNNQLKLRKKLEREEYSNSNPSFLAASFHGGPRHLKQLANNALIIVSQRGDPTIFLTATCNHLWPEITEMLHPGQTAFDRPDITVRIFHDKLKILLQNIRNGYYFGICRIIYELRVIEYQHRGLPHAHIVFKLSNTPEKNNEELCSEWIDNYISAQMPDPLNEPELYCNVFKHMIHVCYDGVSGCKRKDGTCKRGYTNTELRNKTKFDEKGYPLYSRKKVEDLKVVPYHKQILLDWNGHINCEFCGKAYVILYLYKYLFKGNKKVKILFDNTNDLHKEDEINHYLRGRLLCSMDAMWRCFGYQTYPATSPSITLIKPKLPNHVNEICKEGKLCDLEVYFRRPECLENLIYTDFFEMYDYGYSYPKKYEQHKSNINIFNIHNVKHAKL